MKVLITGTSSGIGEYVANRLASQGHEVIGLARSPQKEVPFSTHACDISDWSQLDQTATNLARTAAHLDAIICAAAIQGAIGPAMSTDPLLWSQTIRTDLEGTYFTLR